MKSRHLLLSGIAVAIATAGSASAAFVISNAQLSNTGAEILNTGNQVFAWSVNGDTAASVNGIDFNNTQPGAVTFTTGFTTNVDATFPSTGYTPSMTELMNDAVANNANAQNVVMTISGLTPGLEYRLQLLHHQIATAGTRDMEIHFGSTVVTGNGSGTFSAAGTFGRIVTATFDATGSSQDFLIRVGGNDRSVLNAATLFAVPEPSAALLGGLGMLVLLRRRRA